MMVNNMDKICLRFNIWHMFVRTIVTEFGCKSSDTFLWCVITPPAQILHTKASQILSQNL